MHTFMQLLRWEKKSPRLPSLITPLQDENNQSILHKCTSWSTLKDLQNLFAYNYIKFTMPGENSALCCQWRGNTQSLFYPWNGCWYIDKLTLKFTRLLFRLTYLNQYINLSQLPSFPNCSLKDLRLLQQQAPRSKRWFLLAKYYNAGLSRVNAEISPGEFVISAEQVPSSFFMWGGWSGGDSVASNPDMGMGECCFDYLDSFSASQLRTDWLSFLE